MAALSGFKEIDSLMAFNDIVLVKLVTAFELQQGVKTISSFYCCS